MKSLTATMGVAVWLAYLLTGCAEVKTAEIGKQEFNSKCAACHGVNAKGDGPQAALLATKPANLTVLAKNNGGVFPAQRVHEIIDGRVEVIAHGPRTMPVWGREFQIDVPELPPQASMPFDHRETTVRNKIKALVDYLAQLQVK
ncbi:MAG: cytochrome c [Gammaproteobacteria bacterium]|jgi:mono/diheme cytochrome c family protein